MKKRTFIELLIDEPRLEVSCEGGELNPKILWRCSACGVGVSCAPEELLEIQFAHEGGCLGFGGRKRGGAARAADLLQGLAFVCSGEVAPAGVDTLEWVPQAAAHLLEYPELFEAPPFVGGVPQPLEVMRGAFVAIADDLTSVTRR